MLSIIIPVVDGHEMTQKTLQHLHKHGNGKQEIILVDNASESPAFDSLTGFDSVIRNDVNPGVFPSLLQGISAAKNNLVMLLHNDVLLHAPYVDRIVNEFAEDNSLGIAGLFGGRGVLLNGARIHPESNMQGKEWGQHGSIHGHVLETKHPSVIFDSLCLIIRRNYFNTLNLEGMPPHHWYDRILTLEFIRNRYHALTIGIEFDHYGGGTSSNGRATMANFTEQWCKAKGLDIEQNPDYTMYKYGERLFQKRYGRFLPLYVDRDYRYT